MNNSLKVLALCAIASSAVKATEDTSVYRIIDQVVFEEKGCKGDVISVYRFWEAVSNETLPCDNVSPENWMAAKCVDPYTEAGPVREHVRQICIPGNDFHAQGFSHYFPKGTKYTFTKTTPASSCKSGGCEFVDTHDSLMTAILADGKIRLDNGWGEFENENNKTAFGYSGAVCDNHGGRHILFYVDEGQPVPKPHLEATDKCYSVEEVPKDTLNSWIGISKSHACKEGTAPYYYPENIRSATSSASMTASIGLAALGLVAAAVQFL